MPDIIETIKGLGEALDVLANHVPERYLGGSAGAILDAIALLKGQAPHVMTLEEAMDSDGAVFFEDHRDDDGFLCWAFVDRWGAESMFLTLNDSVFESTACEMEDYGKTWRLWSKMPTDEQMEEAKWNA